MDSMVVKQLIFFKIHADEFFFTLMFFLLFVDSLEIFKHIPG